MATKRACLVDSGLSTIERAFLIKLTDRLTQDDIEKVAFLMECAELEGQRALQMFQDLLQQQKLCPFYESLCTLFDDIGRKDLAHCVTAFGLKIKESFAIDSGAGGGAIPGKI